MYWLYKIYNWINEYEDDKEYHVIYNKETISFRLNDSNDSESTTFNIKYFNKNLFETVEMERINSNRFKYW